MALPLAGRRVLVTRAAGQATALAARLQSLGAEVFSLPGILLLSPESWEPLDAAVRDIARFDWMAFTSQNAANQFFARLSALGVAVDALQRLKVAAVGEKTAALLERYGLRVAAVAPRASAESLAELIGPEVRGRRVLWPRGEHAREVLGERLRAAGATEVCAPVCYGSGAPEAGPEATAAIAALERGQIDAVTFASPRSLGGVMEQLGPNAVERLSRCRVVCIGPTTASACRLAGIADPLVAEPHTIEGLTETVRRALG
ncbi:MAG TPA: uroporphyrinogen-III synthase [Myxococcales bacterium]|nr:uroporphyrinogen-III synthase [Myxococcales bacterium]